MRRADRLFQIVQLLRGGRLVTARMLAERLEVSERTIYRDIADLVGSGVPIEGEAGVGYLMRAGFDLPPLMFNRNEIVALVAGARLIRAWGGLEMAEAAEEALVKIAAVLPEAERGRAAGLQIHAYSMPYLMDDETRRRLDGIERAVDARERLVLDYGDAEGAETARVVRPLSLIFWGRTWTLIGWCELRDDFRMFRVDRIKGMTCGERFRIEPGKSLQDFYRMERHRGGFDERRSGAS
ncbi:helix-turn-helix transcriptional regulator [Vannielia litorea]|uniref:Predicted DNA-binding transcriptional regulator YafY, contains an HTH and WYL domains n=1 Tax=Vannielia litorea TaxID=1217970 RepID=A0A1N6DX59_9RHOB|nr:YafY family protein [Vannielia litorea]SIN75375.1 Predicted DNA-binding transcriptional regulator YafY, contains an HTH and WYL domains [Vannielia litorea]